MAKVKAARGKKRKAAAPRGGVGCIVTLVLLLLLGMLFLIYVMGNAHQS